LAITVITLYFYQVVCIKLLPSCMYYIFPLALDVTGKRSSLTTRKVANMKHNFHSHYPAPTVTNHLLGVLTVAYQAFVDGVSTTLSKYDSISDH